MEKKELLKVLLLIFIVIHLLFSYVVGTLNPFEFEIAGRLFEVFLIIVVFAAYIK
jgi:hypothetical protein